MEAIVSAIGALGIPLGSLNQNFGSNTADPGMLFDPTFFPSSKPQETPTSVGYYPTAGEPIGPSTSTASTEPPHVTEKFLPVLENKQSSDDSSNLNVVSDSNKQNKEQTKGDGVKTDDSPDVSDVIPENVPESKLEENSGENVSPGEAENVQSSQDGATGPTPDKSPELLNFHDAVAPNQSLLDQYIPDMMPSSCAGSSSLPSDLLDDQAVNLIPQTSSSMSQELVVAANSDFNAPLPPIAITDSELVQEIGLQGSFNEQTLNPSQQQTMLAGSEYFMAQGDMMETLTKEEEEEMMKTLSKPLYPMMPPVPREPDIEQHQRNVIDHVEDVQDELEHRLGILETQVESKCVGEGRLRHWLCWCPIMVRCYLTASFGCFVVNT